jgi:hypothetical protein
MPIITPHDLGTHIYAEIIDEITRSDASITTLAIDTAIAEAKLYLGRYDLAQLFGTDKDDSSVSDELLKCLVKDIACWHLLRLANPGTDQASYRQAYTDAIATLKCIMTGQAQPPWPYASATSEDIPDGNTISWSSNPRRNNAY